MTDFSKLRPLERSVMRMTATGLSDREIALRLGRSARHIARVRQLAEIARQPRSASSTTSALRPVERCVLRLTEQSESDALIATRLGRSLRFVALVRAMAHYKLRGAGSTSSAVDHPS